MSSIKINQRLDDFREELCARVGCYMYCEMCICEECPRDCEDCRVGLGVEPREEGCLFNGTNRCGENQYREEEQR